MRSSVDLELRGHVHCSTDEIYVNLLKRFTKVNVPVDGTYNPESCWHLSEAPGVHGDAASTETVILERLSPCDNLEVVLVQDLTSGSFGRGRIIRALARGFMRLLAVLLVLVSLLSLIDANEWWIRIWDFPRLQILAGIALVTLLLVILDRRARWWLAVPLVLAGSWQLYRIHPYSPLVKPEVPFIGSERMPESSCFSVLSFNVLQDNRDYQSSLEMLRSADPDILLLLETDVRWEKALEPVLSGYPHRLHRPLNNTYGLIFATRLPMDDGRIEDIVERDTPSVSVQLIAGAPFRLIGLHPRPPSPGQDTEERDAEIAIAAQRAASEALPVLAIGDFNDVAWSDTSRMFKRMGGYLDPRIGRGTYATFPARWPWLAWPLDHLFITPEFSVRTMRVLDDVGSDHRPIYSELCLAPKGSPARNATPEAATPGDRKHANETMVEYREDQVREGRGND